MAAAAAAADSAETNTTSNAENRGPHSVFSNFNLLNGIARFACSDFLRAQTLSDVSSSWRETISDFSGSVWRNIIASSGNKGKHKKELAGDQLLGIAAERGYDAVIQHCVLDKGVNVDERSTVPLSRYGDQYENLLVHPLIRAAGSLSCGRSGGRRVRAIRTLLSLGADPTATLEEITFRSYYWGYTSRRQWHSHNTQSLDRFLESNRNRSLPKLVHGIPLIYGTTVLHILARRLDFDAITAFLATANLIRKQVLEHNAAIKEEERKRLEEERAERERKKEEEREQLRKEREEKEKAEAERMAAMPGPRPPPRAAAEQKDENDDDDDADEKNTDFESQVRPLGDFWNDVDAAELPNAADEQHLPSWIVTNMKRAARLEVRKIGESRNRDGTARTVGQRIHEEYEAVLLPVPGSVTDMSYVAACDGDGMSALAYACASRAPRTEKVCQTVALLIKMFPVLIDMPSETGMSPTMYACQAGNLAAIRALFEAPNAEEIDLTRCVSATGVTAMHLAAAAGARTIIEMMYEVGGSVREKDKNGLSVYDYAVKGKHGSLAKTIQKMILAEGDECEGVFDDGLDEFDDY